MEGQETLRRFAGVRVDTLIWLVFAFVLFAISAWLTYLITNVEQKHGRTGVAITFLGVGPADPRPKIDFETNGMRLNVTIHDIAVKISTVRLGAFSRAEQAAVQCATSDRDLTTSWEAATNDELPETQDATTNDSAARPLSYVVHLTLQDVAALKKQFGAEGLNYRLAVKLLIPASLTCSLPSDVTDDTYTSRALDVTVSDGLFAPAGSHPLDLLTLPKQENFFPRQLSLHNDDAQEIHVSNIETGATLLASSVTAPFTGYDPTDLHHAVTEHFAWESKSATSRRDILITLIGTLIALGAAALIEACRPYIEILVRQRPKS